MISHPKQIWQMLETAVFRNMGINGKIYFSFDTDVSEPSFNNSETD